MNIGEQIEATEKMIQEVLNSDNKFERMFELEELRVELDDLLMLEQEIQQEKYDYE